MVKVLKKSMLFVIIAMLISCLCIGCGGDQPSTVRVTSYVSTDSTVYSTTAEVVKQVANTVVEIKTETVATRGGMQYVISGAGSGVIVAHDDSFSTYYIVTNNHVVEGAQQIDVTLRSGDNYRAELVAADAAGDIAVVSIREESTLNIAVIGNSDSLQIGEDLIAIGNPLGSLGGTITKGILSATERSIPVGNYRMTLLQTDTAINPGNSGGGLFNMRGELVGIVNAKTSDEEVEGICFAIPVNTVMAIYDDLINYGSVRGRVTLGISVAQGSNGTVYVTSVDGGASGGFAVYDRVLSLNGEQVSSLLEFNDVLSGLRPNDNVTVRVNRGRKVGNVYVQAIEFSADVTEFDVVARQI